MYIVEQGHSNKYILMYIVELGHSSNKYILTYSKVENSSLTLYSSAGLYGKSFSTRTAMYKTCVILKNLCLCVNKMLGHDLQKHDLFMLVTSSFTNLSLKLAKNSQIFAKIVKRNTVNTEQTWHTIQRYVYCIVYFCNYVYLSKYF